MNPINIAGKNSKRIHLRRISMKNVGGGDDTNEMGGVCVLFYNNY